MLVLPMFDSIYGMAAIEELNKDIRFFEEKFNYLYTYGSPGANIYLASLRARIEFAQRIMLISVEQGEVYRSRITKSLKMFESLHQNETCDDVNNFENQHKIASRYRKLDDYNAVIASERTKAEARGIQKEQADSRVDANRAV